CRLLTLLGPGGIGKTRLAVEAARRAAPRFGDGVCFVPLAPVLDPELVLATVADALGLDLFRREKVRDLLVDYLRPRAVLLVADNFEHLTSAGEQLAGLLEAAPGLTIITTSRERLAVPGEWTLDIGGLSLPEGEGPARQAAAVQLFLQSARRVTGGHDPDDDELAAVARLCRLVGGTPLAIELAATWARLMPYAEIAAAIARDLDFLAVNARGVPERHRGPRAVFEHSWRLLDPIDQGAFRRLAVFCGGFTRDAAAAVLGLHAWPASNREAMAAFLGDAAPPDSRQVALAALAALTDRSLVRVVGEGRYDVHELLRQYAAERLADDPADQAAARDAHATYYLGLLSRQEASLKGTEQRAALALIDADLDNVRCAWRHAIASASWSALAGALESLFLFYEIESLHEEGEDAFGRAVAAAAAVADPPESLQMLLANLLARWGWFALRLYRFQPARAILDWSLHLIERLGPRRETVFAEILASSQNLTGGRAVSDERLRGLVGRLRDFGDRWSLAFALNSLAYVAPTYAESEALLVESLAISRSIGDRQGIASCLDELAAIAGDRAQMRKAVSYWEEALALYRAMGYRWAYAFCLDKLGYARRRMGDYDAAEALHRESLEGSRAVGDRLGIAGSLDNLGLVALDRGDYAAAEALISEGLAIRRAVGHSGSTAVSYLSLASLEIARGRVTAGRAALDTCVADADPDARWLFARVQRLRARAALAEADAGAAWEHLREALRLAYDSTSGYEVAATLASMAETRLLAGDGRGAAELATVALEEGREVRRVRLQAEAVLSRTVAPAAIRTPTELAAALLDRATGEA
ncbi:MAG TPA: tetratricopeptide repeat protein, partial [Chloroflexaceae bacterium]|nr:tetratricopeptide repeat protein [Chloroflexaceae bacterium]